MNLRQRHRGSASGTTAEGDGSDDLLALRDDIAALLGAGDDAIDRALSQDSRAWLAANRQHGGQ